MQFACYQKSQHYMPYGKFFCLFVPDSEKHSCILIMHSWGSILSGTIFKAKPFIHMSRFLTGTESHHYLQTFFTLVWVQSLQVCFNSTDLLNTAALPMLPFSESLNSSSFPPSPHWRFLVSTSVKFPTDPHYKSKSHQ